MRDLRCANASQRAGAARRRRRGMAISLPGLQDQQCRDHQTISSLRLREGSCPTKTLRNAERASASGAPPIVRRPERPIGSGDWQILTSPAWRPVPTGKPIARRFAHSSASIALRRERGSKNAAIPTHGTPAPRRFSECGPRHGELSGALPPLRGAVPTAGGRGGR
jgi:hypothetical protein